MSDETIKIQEEKQLAREIEQAVPAASPKAKISYIEDVAAMITDPAHNKIRMPSLRPERCALIHDPLKDQCQFDYYYKGRVLGSGSANKQSIHVITGGICNDGYYATAGGPIPFAIPSGNATESTLLTQTSGSYLGFYAPVGVPRMWFNLKKTIDSGQHNINAPLFFNTDWQNGRAMVLPYNESFGPVYPIAVDHAGVSVPIGVSCQATGNYPPDLMIGLSFYDVNGGNAKEIQYISPLAPSWNQVVNLANGIDYKWISFSLTTLIGGQFNGVLNFQVTGIGSSNPYAYSAQALRNVPSTVQSNLVGLVGGITCLARSLMISDRSSDYISNGSVFAANLRTLDDLGEIVEENVYEQLSNIEGCFVGKTKDGVYMVQPPNVIVKDYKGIFSYDTDVPLSYACFDVALTNGSYGALYYSYDSIYQFTTESALFEKEYSPTYFAELDVLALALQAGVRPTHNPDHLGLIKGTLGVVSELASSKAAKALAAAVPGGAVIRGAVEKTSKVGAKVAGNAQDKRNNKQKEQQKEVVKQDQPVKQKP